MGQVIGARGDLTLEVSIEGLDEAVKSLEPLEDIERNLDNILLETAIDMAAFAQNRITDSVDPMDVPYEPLAESTQKARRRSGQKPPYIPLKWKGRMWRSIFARALKDGLEFGTHVGYSIFHQQGGENLPRRAFFPLTVDNDPEPDGAGGEFWRVFDEKLSGILK